MNKILKVRKVGDYIRYHGGQEQHPLVGIVDSIRHSLNNYGVYGVFMHGHPTVDLKYGCGKYNHQSGGTVICVTPGQIGGKEDNGERMELDRWALNKLFNSHIILDDYFLKKAHNIIFAHTCGNRYGGNVEAIRFETIDCLKFFLFQAFFNAFFYSLY